MRDEFNDGICFIRSLLDNARQHWKVLWANVGAAVALHVAARRTAWAASADFGPPQHTKLASWALLYYALHSRRALLTYYIARKKWCALTESSVIVHTLSLNQPPARPSVNDNKKEDLKANLKSEPPKEQDIKIVLGPHSALCPKFKA